MNSLKFRYYLAIFLFGILSFSFVSSPVLTATSSTATDIGSHLQSAGGGSGAGYGKTEDPRSIAMGVIRVVLNFLAVIFLILIIYAGFLWMTAGGKEENMEKAKKILFRSVIGIIIVLSAYSITWAAFKIALNYYDDPSGPGVKVAPYYAN